MISINRQLRKYFIFVTALAVLLVFILSNLGMTVFFNGYVKQANLRSDQKIIEYISELLRSGESLSIGSLPGLVQIIRGEEAEVKIVDSAGTLVWDSSLMSNMHGKMYRGQGSGQSAEQGSGQSGWGMMGNGQGIGGSSGIQNKDLVYRSYPLQVDGYNLGVVEIGREEEVFSSAEDRDFLLTMNLVYVIALVLSILLVLFISKAVASKFLHPLLVVKNNLHSIAGSGKNKLAPVSSDTREIQELVLATEELARTIEEQDKLRKRLTSDLAHELRTPLATIQSHLEAMIDGIWEATPERLSLCYDELIRLTRLINDLNELSVIESDRTRLNKTKLSLSNLLRDLLENYQLIFTEKDIKFASSIPDGIEIIGDNDRLKQVFVNILSNAYKYTPEGGKVSVNLSVESGWAVVEVQDTGRGISAEDLPYIFERFYRGDLSRSRESGGGAGIGLTITKALVEAHQGSLEVQSQQGIGTTVIIKLPS